MNLINKLLASALVALVINLVCVASAPARRDKEEQFAPKVKAAILKLGTGPAARIEIKLRDGTKLKGYVAEAGPDRFVVIDDKTGATRDVPYPQVKRVRGNNLSTGVKIAIGIAIAVGVLVVFALIFPGR